MVPAGARPPPAVARGVAESARGGLGVAVGRDGGGVRAGGPEQPHHLDLVQHRRGDRYRHPRGGYLGIQLAARGRGRQRQHRVDARIGAGQLHALAEAPRADQHGGIDRPGHGGRRGQDGPEHLLGIQGERGDLQARVAARVSGEHRGAAGVGHYRDPAAGGYRLRGEQGRGVEHLAEVRGGDHSGLLEQGLPGEQRGSGRGARPGQAPARDGPAHVHGQDRHGAGHPAGGAGELGRVPDRFHVQHGQLGTGVGSPPQQHVLAGYVVFVAQRDQGRDPGADPGQMVDQHEAGAAGRLQGQPHAAQPRMTGRIRRVQADAGVGHPEAGRPDHAHAVPAADIPELRAGRAAEARRDHHQRPDPALPAFLGDAGHGRRRHGDDRQVDALGQRGRRRHAAGAFQFGHGRVDRVDRAGEAAAQDVPQDRPPDRPGPPARADHRDRRGPQHVLQARHAGRPFALGHRLAVGAERDVGLAGRQREGQVVHAVGQGAVGLQPGVGEHLQHERVLAQRLRREGVQAAAAGQRDQVFQQQHPDAAVVHVVGDREGDLR